MTKTYELPYGAAQTLQLEPNTATRVDRCGQPAGDALDDPLAAVAASLVEPHQFPALAEATVPGDKVVIAVNHGVPQAAAIVGAIVRALIEGRVAARDILVLLPRDGNPMTPFQEFLPQSSRGEIRWERHDPTRSDQLAYLAASKEGVPIMINRRICDADMVIPVGCLRSDKAWGASNETLGVFPAFADEATARRFQTPAEWRGQAASRSAAEEIAEVTWLLGLQFTVQVIPAAGDQLLQVLSGGIDAVAELGKRLAKKAWEFRVSQPAELVVAAIAGGADQQTWENLARALHAAARIVKQDGAIALCSEISDPPGPALRQLIDYDDLDSTRAELARNADYDARWADIIAGAMQSVRVYLLSRLEADVVEDMGFAPVTDPHHVSNLCRRASDCLLIANAQHAVPLMGDGSVMRNTRS